MSLFGKSLEERRKEIDAFFDKLEAEGGVFFYPGTVELADGTRVPFDGTVRPWQPRKVKDQDTQS